MFTREDAFHLKPMPKVHQALSFRTPGIFRELELLKNLSTQNLMILRNVQYWPKFLVSYKRNTGFFYKKLGSGHSTKSFVIEHEMLSILVLKAS